MSMAAGAMLKLLPHPHLQPSGSGLSIDGDDNLAVEAAVMIDSDTEVATPTLPPCLLLSKPNVSNFRKQRPMYYCNSF